MHNYARFLKFFCGIIHFFLINLCGILENGKPPFIFSFPLSALNFPLNLESVDHLGHFLGGGLVLL